MRRVDTVKVAENLRIANELAKTGIDFVCIPVYGEFTKEKLVSLLKQQLAAIEKEAAIKDEEKGADVVESYLDSYREAWRLYYEMN